MAGLRLSTVHARTHLQLWLGLCAGIVFGFLLHKGGITRYDTILGQLLLQDFTMIKIMISAVIVGMIGFHALQKLGLVTYHLKPGSIGSTVIGGLIFGIGFAILGYCPGTLVGAAGNGFLDALTGGLAGMLLGAWLFSLVYVRLKTVFSIGFFGDITFPRLFKANAWIVVVLCVIGLSFFLFVLEETGN
jgi:hypothetical protein